MKLNLKRANVVLTLFIAFSILLFMVERAILLHFFRKGLVLDTLEDQLVAFYNLSILGFLLHFLILLVISFGGRFYFCRHAVFNEEDSKEIRRGFIYSSIFVILLGVFYVVAFFSMWAVF